jgi:hypothetical protein
MMAGYYRNVQKPVYRIKEWYKSVHIVGFFYYIQQYCSEYNGWFLGSHIFKTIKQSFFLPEFLVMLLDKYMFYEHVIEFTLTPFT